MPSSSHTLHSYGKHVMSSISSEKRYHLKFEHGDFQGNGYTYIKDMGDMFDNKFVDVETKDRNLLDLSPFFSFWAGVYGRWALYQN